MAEFSYLQVTVTILASITTMLPHHTHWMTFIISTISHVPLPSFPYMSHLDHLSVSHSLREVIEILTTSSQLAIIVFKLAPDSDGPGS
jgi:hypothetical protein